MRGCVECGVWGWWCGGWRKVEKFVLGGSKGDILKVIDGLNEWENG